MKEDFLHYVWNYKKFDFLNLKTTINQAITVVKTGEHNHLEGPDFFNAQLIIDSQKWIGTVEIHCKSSDWFLHNHENDTNYNSVILHVVWEHDTPVFNSSNSEIPVLELKNYVNQQLVAQFANLKTPKTWIYCEDKIKTVSEFVTENWYERVFFERLEKKVLPIEKQLEITNNDWEAVLFCFLAKNFGLNTNGEAFFQIAQSIPFSIIRKEVFEVKNLEALFFGFANLLEPDCQDNYCQDLKTRFEYLKNKYQLKDNCFISTQFFKHRPDNFPTIRLSQLANLYHEKQQLFYEIIQAKKYTELHDIFETKASIYWQTHYQFDKNSSFKSKKLSKSFVDLLLINTILPIKFAYQKHNFKDISEDLIALLSQIPPENNRIIQKFASVGIKSANAFETQSLLQLKNEYCDKGKCLECAIGIELLK